MLMAISFHQRKTSELLLFIIVYFVDVKNVLARNPFSSLNSVNKFYGFVKEHNIYMLMFLL